MYGNNACICLPYCMNKDLGRVSAVVKLRLRHRAQTMARAYKLHTKMTLRSVVPGRRASGPHLGLIPNPPLADLWPALLPVSYRHRRTPKLHQRLQQRCIRMLARNLRVVHEQGSCMEDACSDMPPHCFVLSSYAWGTASLGVGTLIDCRFLFSPGRMATLPRMVLLWIATTRLGGRETRQKRMQSARYSGRLLSCRFLTARGK